MDFEKLMGADQGIQKSICLEIWEIAWGCMLESSWGWTQLSLAGSIFHRYKVCAWTTQAPVFFKAPHNANGSLHWEPVSQAKRSQRMWVRVYMCHTLGWVCKRNSSQCYGLWEIDGVCRRWRGQFFKYFTRVFFTTCREVVRDGSVFELMNLF